MTPSFLNNKTAGQVLDMYALFEANHSLVIYEVNDVITDTYVENGQILENE